MKIKYLVYGNSSISPIQVALSFKVNPRECIFVFDEYRDLRGINTSDYIELFADYKGRYNLRALILSRRTKYDYDTCINFINRYYDIEFGNCQLEFYDLWLINFVVNNLREDE